MPLIIEDCGPRTIVDHSMSVRQVAKGGKSFLEESHRDEIRRGIIVHCDGEPDQSGGVEAVWVYFGKSAVEDFIKAKVRVKNVTINGTTVKAVNIPAAELHRVHKAGSTASRKAWEKLFGASEAVGGLRRRSGGMRKAAAVVSDELGVTPEPKQGPVEDNRDALPDIPAREDD